MGGVDEHALWHSGGTPRRAAAAASEAAGGAVLWGGKPVASDVMASRDSVIGVASVITARLRVLTICIARRRGPALRQASLPVLPVDVATPPGETPGWRMSHRAIYRANRAITMISSEGVVPLAQRTGAGTQAPVPVELPNSPTSRGH
jgi:hypothetical protein